MKGGAPTLPADALLAEIRRQAAAQQQALLDSARAEAAAITARARDKAQRQLRRTQAERRATRDDRQRQLAAELDTLARQQAAMRSRAALDTAWPQLAPALRRRWADAAARAAWVEALVAQGAARLPAQGWRLRHPVIWSADDQHVLQAALRRHGIDTVEMLADDRIDAGLVIECDGVRLDGTPAALLADRARVEAELLALLATAEAGDG
jgi:vacuolar-type H+-ATPase subunit E/Vma4